MLVTAGLAAPPRDPRFAAPWTMECGGSGLTFKSCIQKGAYCDKGNVNTSTEEGVVCVNDCKCVFCPPCDWGSKNKK